MPNQVVNKFNKFFIKNGFVIVDGILNSQLLLFLKTSSKFIDLQTHKEDGNNIVTGPVANFQYASIIGDTLLTYLTPYYSKIVEKTLVPTYSFFRTYQKGSKLEPHKDRAACQYSATIQINRSKDEDWPFYIQNEKSSFVANCPLGQLIFYKGEEVLHWRDSLKYESSSHIFLHWVDSSDPNYKDYWYDGKSSLGLPFNPY